MDYSILGKKESVQSYIFGFSFILIMVISSLYFDDKEIILPEIAALSIGIFTFRENKWLQQPFHIFLLPSITAILGFGINFLAIPFLLKLIIILIAMLLILRIFKSQLAPSLATGLLPIVTNAHSFLFLFAIFMFVFLLFIFIKLFKIKPTEQTSPVIYESHNRLLICLFLIWSVICHFSGYNYYAAIPPVIVVAFESLNNPALKLKVRLKRILALFISSIIGCLTIKYLNNFLLASFIDLMIVSSLLFFLNLRLPPAFAMVILPMIMPEKTIEHLPLATFIMSTFFIMGIFMIQKQLYPDPIDF